MPEDSPPHLPGQSSLVTATLDGDLDAFGALYDHYAPDVSTYCHGRLRDGEDAGKALYATFVRAHGALAQLEDPVLVRGWLFGVARITIDQVARQRHRGGHRRDWGAVVTPDHDTAQRVMDAAADLQPEDQDLFWLHLREGLDGRELAIAMDAAPDRLPAMQDHLYDRLTTTLRPLLAATDERAACPDLDLILRATDKAVSVDGRSRIIHHAQGCDICREVGRDSGPWRDLAATLPITSPPSGVRSMVMTTLDPAPAGETSASETDIAAPIEVRATAVETQSAAPEHRRRRTPTRRAALIAFLLIAVVVIGMLLAWPALTSDDADNPATTAPATTITLATAPPSTAAPTTAAPSTAAPSSAATVPADAAPTTVPADAAIGPVFFGSPDPIELTAEARSFSYRFANVGDESMNWRVEITGPFVVLPGTGTLDPETSATFTVTLNPEAGDSPALGLLRLDTGTSVVEVIVGSA